MNAAGPWVDKIRAIDQSLKGKRLHHTKGVHLVFPYEKLALKHSLYFDAMDGRMVFAIPRGKITYVGTTDTSYQGDLHEPGVTQADVEYVLGAANRMFPEANLQASDIISTWSGLRPLIHEDGKSPSELSRKDEIFYSNTQLISIAGGKLTGFRKMAERVTNVVVKRLEKNGLIEDRPNCLTANIRLVGNGFHDAEAVEDYIHLLASEHVALGLDEQNAAYLVYNYGKQSDEILEKAYSLQSSYEENALVVAELDFCLRNEMVTRLQDFLIRRTGRLYFDRPSIMPIFADCLDYAASFLGWDAQEKDRQKQDFMRLYEGVVNFGGEVYVE